MKQQCTIAFWLIQIVVWTDVNMQGCCMQHQCFKHEDDTVHYRCQGTAPSRLPTTPIHIKALCNQSRYKSIMKLIFKKGQGQMAALLEAQNRPSRNTITIGTKQWVAEQGREAVGQLLQAGQGAASPEQGLPAPQKPPPLAQTHSDAVVTAQHSPSSCYSQEAVWLAQQLHGLLTTACLRSVISLTQTWMRRFANAAQMAAVVKTSHCAKDSEPGTQTQTFRSTALLSRDRGAV